MRASTSIIGALILSVLVSWSVSVDADSNNVLSIYFPTNVALGMEKSLVGTNRPIAADSVVNLSSTNSPSPKMLEPATILGSWSMYCYHFVDNELRAITSGVSTNVSTNDLVSQIETNAFSHVSSEAFLRWSGTSTNLSEITVDIWQWTNQDVRLCSGVFSNETTLVLYDKTIFSPSNFFTPSSQRDAMQGVVNKFGQ